MMRKIHFIIPTYTSCIEQYNMTLNCIQSVKDSITFAKLQHDNFDITIVESCVNALDHYEDCQIVNYDSNRFNYNHALNLGIHQLTGLTDDDWICNMNNDVICKVDWLVPIFNTIEQNNDIMSICPTLSDGFDHGIEYGYTLGQHLDGCCFMYNSCLVEKLNLWDEQFEFTYQDDDYLELLRKYNIKHVRCYESVIKHLGSKTIHYNKQIDNIGIQAFIKKWSYDTLCLRNFEKRTAALARFHRLNHNKG